ncbi:MAG TPA: hypothetical protein VLF87_01240, partial [Patescibacteria group bacterium]|nr:hypothetical protein [Patescibacteria group bacterium]
MFRKLLSNLPFNPSLINQVSFYAKRMHREQAIRRTGFALIALSIVVQMFAVISPPKPTLAASSNDIIYSGFHTRDEAVLYCIDSHKDINGIFAYYGITCDMVNTAQTIQLNSRDYSDQLDSLGRNPQGATIARTGKPTDEYGVNINGSTFYMKNLWAWDSGNSSTY